MILLIKDSDAARLVTALKMMESAGNYRAFMERFNGGKSSNRRALDCEREVKRVIKLRRYIARKISDESR